MTKDELLSALDSFEIIGFGNKPIFITDEAGNTIPGLTGIVLIVKDKPIVSEADLDDLQEMIASLRK